MNYFIRKIYFSLFLSLLVVMTTVTVTFAFLTTNRNVYVDKFNMSIGGNGSDNARKSGLVLSIDGTNFKTDLDGIDIKKAILMKKGYSQAISMNNDEVNNLYSKYSGLLNLTPANYLNLSDGFHTLTGDTLTQEGYISFDLYVSTTNTNYSNQQYLSLYFSDDIMSNCEAIDSDLLIDVEDIHPTLNKIPDTIKVSAENAARLGIVTYQAQDKGNASALSNQISSQIFRFDDNKCNASLNGIYNFGGITPRFYTNANTNVSYQLDPNNPDDQELYNSSDSYVFNYMQKYYNTIMPLKIRDEVFESDELKYRDTYDKYIYNSCIFDSSMKLTYDKMVKLTVYLWIEGWDSDCFNTILSSKLDFDLKFTTDYVPES